MNQPNLTVAFTCLREGATPPARATTGAAGYDLCACLDAPLMIAPQSRVMVPTGIALALPNADCVALLFARSGLSLKQGLTMANGVGVVDSDYRGEVFILLANLSDQTRCIEHGDRMAQLLLMPVFAADFCAVAALPDTTRGAGGMGSTGR